MRTAPLHDAYCRCRACKPPLPDRDSTEIAFNNQVRLAGIALIGIVAAIALAFH